MSPSQPDPPPRRPAAVPPSSAVRPGVPVFIVLKADQPTGRQVSGTVSQVLGRGDHPRGIKVRLADGRVGRVQRLAEETEASGASAEGGTRERENASARYQNGRTRWRGGRDTEEDPLPPETIGLDAYIKPAKAKRKGKRGGGEGLREEVKKDGEEASGAGAQFVSGGERSECITCPVCGAFEGDEAAVAHHVAGHFDS